MLEGESLDITAIEDLDPSIVDGSTIIYDREVPFEVRNQNGDEPVRQGTVETVKVKLMVTGTEREPRSIRVELSSEADLFFHYHHIIDEVAYRRVQEQQKLMINFVDYANVMIRMLNSCIREPTTHMAIFLMHGENDARLDFIQNMEYKFVELLSCVFERSSDETAQHHITYRYNAMKQKLGIMQARLHELNTLVKTKNPSLLLQLQKYPNMNFDLNTSGNNGTSGGSSSGSVLNNGEGARYSGLSASGKSLNSSTAWR